MKVLHINCNYVGTSLHRIMASHLKSQDIQPVIYTPLWNADEMERFKPRSDEVVDVCFKRWDRLFYFAKQRKIFASVNRKVEDLREFEMIHAFTLLTDGNVAYKLSGKYGIPYVVAIRDTDVNSFFRLKPYLRPLGVKIMRNAKAVFFLSNSYKESVISRYVPEKYRKAILEKTHVIPNGIDDFWLENLYSSRDISATEQKIQNHTLSVVCVGKINRRKNIPTLQKALAILRKRGWTIDLSVIGKVEDDSEINQIKQDPYTTCYPPTNKEGLIDYYRKADLFVLASHTETFGLVYAEAMSQGLPVIYTRGQGFDGQFREGEVGYAVSDTNPEEIADAIEKVCGEYGRIARNVTKCVQKFKWDDICEEYRKIYRGIVND